MAFRRSRSLIEAGGWYVVQSAAFLAGLIKKPQLIAVTEIARAEGPDTDTGADHGILVEKLNTSSAV